MNHLKVYFLAYFMQNSQKLNMVGYTASNMWPKRYGGPCIILRNTSSSLAETSKALLWEILVYKNSQGNCRQIATEFDSQKSREICL